MATSLTNSLRSYLRSPFACATRGERPILLGMRAIDDLDEIEDEDLDDDEDIRLEAIQYEMRELRIAVLLLVLLLMAGFLYLLFLVR